SPAAGPLVAIFFDRGRARPAADARVALVVKRIVRHFVIENELPNVLLGPAQKRVDLHQVEFRIPLNRARGLAVFRLVAANGADPGRVPPYRAAEGENLAVVTALVRAMHVERAAVLLLVLGDGQLGADQFDRDSIAFANPLAEFESLRE